MKGYWARIAIKAGVIFVVGFALITMFRTTKKKVVHVVEGSGDVTIPLAFVPFSFDGERLGTFRKLVIHRTGPEQPSGIDLTVRLTDRAQLSRLGGCELTVDDPTRIDERTSFRCVGDGDDQLESFGAVMFQAKDQDGNWSEAERIVLKIPSSVAARIRGSEDPAVDVIEAESDRFSQIGDSLGALGAALATATSDSVRGEIQDRMRELGEQMAEVRAIEAAARGKVGAARIRAKAAKEAPAAERP